MSAERWAKARVVMVSGDEQPLRREAIQDLYAALGESFDRDEAETILADTRKPSDWIGAAGTASFFAERRVVLVRNLLRTSPDDGLGKAPKPADHPLAAEMERLPESAMLVLVADDEPGDGFKQQRLGTLRGRWERVVQAGGGEVVRCQSDPSKLPAALRERARNLEVELAPKAATLLSEMTGGRLTLAAGELEKLAVYVGPGGTIGERHVIELVAPENEYNVFKLVDAVVAGDAGQALKELTTLFGNKAKVAEEAFPRVLPMLHRQFRLIWQARTCYEAGCPASSPTSDVEATFPDKNRLSKERPFVQKRAMGSARRLGRPEIAACLTELSHTDARLKGQLPGVDAIETLERMALSLCAICARKR